MVPGHKHFEAAGYTAIYLLLGSAGITDTYFSMPEAFDIEENKCRYKQKMK